MQLIRPIGSGNNLFTFRHSLTRHAILSDLLPPDLAGRSARAAAELESAHPGLPGAWCELAAELHEAAGDRVRAARLLHQLGRRALDQGALSTAITSLTDAHDLLAAPRAAEPMLAIEIDEALVDALAHAGDYGRLIPVAAAADRRARCRRGGSAAAGAGHDHCREGQLRGSLHCLRRAAVSRPRHCRPAARCRARQPGGRGGGALRDGRGRSRRSGRAGPQGAGQRRGGRVRRLGGRGHVRVAGGDRAQGAAARYRGGAGRLRARLPDRGRQRLRHLADQGAAPARHDRHAGRRQHGPTERGQRAGQPGRCYLDRDRHRPAAG